MFWDPEDIKPERKIWHHQALHGCVCGRTCFSGLPEAWVLRAAASLFDRVHFLLSPFCLPWWLWLFLPPRVLLNVFPLVPCHVVFVWRKLGPRSFFRSRPAGPWVSTAEQQRFNLSNRSYLGKVNYHSSGFGLKPRPSHADFLFKPFVCGGGGGGAEDDGGIG